MDDQERNREALIEHIAEQDRIIRRRNEQIAQQAENSREAQNTIEDIEAELEAYRKMHSQQIKTITRLQENPRPLTADDITDEMVLRFMNAFDTQADGSVPAPTLNHFTAARTAITRAALIMTLTPPPARPEGAEKVEAVLNQYWSGDIDGTDLADRIVEEMNR